MLKEPLVILVDNDDLEIGAMPKMDAHINGVLHRALSVFVFTPEGKMILQKRNHEKYHSGGLWSNTCCSHPLPGENTEDAAKRRLFEEMGLLCHLEKAFSFVYKAKLDNELIEHEYDHVFIGETEKTPAINPEEVADWKALSQSELKKELATHPETYTFWFKEICDKVFDLYQASKE